MIIIVALLVLLALFPNPQPFSETLSSSINKIGQSVFNPPSGSQVTGSWSTVDGRMVDLKITDAGGGAVYNEQAVSGSFRFMASNPPYTFSDQSVATEAVKVTGTYSPPFL